jgi:hypothetical protein
LNQNDTEIWIKGFIKNSSVCPSLSLLFNWALSKAGNRPKAHEFCDFPRIQRKLITKMAFN